MKYINLFHVQCHTMIGTSTSECSCQINLFNSHRDIEFYFMYGDMEWEQNKCNILIKCCLK